MREADDNARVIDVVGYVKKLWAHKLVFLIAFLVVLIPGTAWVMTRPAQYDVTQTVLVSLPSVQEEAQATQQQAALAGTVANLVRIAKLPMVADPVMAAHPEIETLEEYRLSVDVVPVGPLAVEIKATGDDPQALTSLITDVAQSWVQVAPATINPGAAHLDLALSAIGEPVVTATANGRLIRLVAVGALAVIAATVATAIAAARPKRGAV
ncbi:MAG TPA: hypothetical protein K8V15_09905 [Tessaracoccus flavescens]|uniref:Polysaccharide chain length determinant N-terminal domain-containing protein n=1 Tax=Tessaracoccus flavescens TaxID=399497 RepID=A0A921JRD8_9ACTN|nr:hypothetical protein [Tessaracoccus flavescens]